MPAAIGQPSSASDMVDVRRPRLPLGKDSTRVASLIPIEGTQVLLSAVVQRGRMWSGAGSTATWRMSTADAMRLRDRS